MSWVMRVDKGTSWSVAKDGCYAAQPCCSDIPTLLRLLPDVTGNGFVNAQVSRASSRLCSGKFPVKEERTVWVVQSEHKHGLGSLEKILALFGSLGTRQNCSRTRVCEHGSAREPSLMAAISLSLDDEEIDSLRAWDGFRSRPEPA